MDEHAHIWHRRHQFVGGVSAHRHEAPGAKAHLPAIADKDVQPDRRDGVDQEGQEQRVYPVVIDHEGNDEDRDEQHHIVTVAVEFDRKGLLVFGVSRAEIACFTIEH